MAGVKLSSAPALEPVTLAEAMAHMRVDLSDDNTLITNLITAARGIVEELTSRKLIEQTWIYYLDGFPAGSVVELPFAPVSSVSGITYTPEGGTATTWSSSEYIADTTSEPARIVLKEDYDWPDSDYELIEANGIAITFKAGYGAAASTVPEELKLAIKLLVAHFYENREAIQLKDLSALPMGVRYILEPFKLRFPWGAQV